MSITQGHRDTEIHRIAAQISDDYRLATYMLWYNAGKPSAEALHRSLEPDPQSGIRPTVSVIRGWIRDSFIPMALEMDEQVIDTVSQAMINQRIEMLDRHAQVARRMQEMALEFLEENGLGSSKNALVALINGIKMEHDARIVPTDFMAKLGAMSDDKLLDELKDMISGGQILEIGPNIDANKDTQEPR
jgi:hypothetical protein